MNTKPFDPTKPVQQRNGRAARILATDHQNPKFPIVAEMQYGDGFWCIAAFTKDGGYSPHGEHDYDLVNIPAKHKLEGFVNVYPDGCNCYCNKFDADYASHSTRIACLDLSKYNIEFEEGEGL